MTPTERSSGQGSSASPRAAQGPRRPVHVAVAIGLGTGVYAFSLATVTVLQAETDRALIADREPVAAAIGLLADHHDGLGASLETARLRYEVATRAYGDLAGGLEALHQQLDTLGASIRAVEGMRFSVPGLTAAIPQAVTGGVRSTVPKASSGSTSSSGTSAGGSTSGGSGVTTAVVTPVAVVLPPPPPAAAPPPTQGTTGASGVP